MNTSSELLQQTLLSDNELVTYSLRESHYYSILIERYEERLTRYIHRLGLVTKEDIEDILQETFINAYKHLNSFNTSLSFSSWIYRIAHNQTISFFRKRNVRPEGHLYDGDDEKILSIPDISDTLSEVTKKESVHIIHSALMRIESKYRDVIMLHDLEGMSYGEISDILQIPLGTVATHLSRGREALKKDLIQHGYVH